MRSKWAQLDLNSPFPRGVQTPLGGVPPPSGGPDPLPGGSRLGNGPFPALLSGSKPRPGPEKRGPDPRKPRFGGPEPPFRGSQNRFLVALKSQPRLMPPLRNREIGPIGPISSGEQIGTLPWAQNDLIGPIRPGKRGPNGRFQTPTGQS